MFPLKNLACKGLNHKMCSDITLLLSHLAGASELMKTLNPLLYLQPVYHATFGLFVQSYGRLHT